MLRLSIVTKLLLLLAMTVASPGRAQKSTPPLMLECPELRSAEVCALAGAGFVFNDGCNRVRCLDNGLWMATRRGCRRAEEPDELLRCKEVAHRVFESIQGGIEKSEESESGSDEKRSEQEFECPALAAGRICEASTNGFSYSDGCNSITCHADGTGQSTFRYCPQPEASDEAGQAYCQAAEKKMRAKMERSSLRKRCLLPEDVCQGPSLRRIAYSDGCNRCFCVDEGQDACTRRGCPEVLMTDDEFKEYCQERGAGIN